MSLFYRAFEGITELPFPWNAIIMWTILILYFTLPIAGFLFLVDYALDSYIETLK